MWWLKPKLIVLVRFSLGCHYKPVDNLFKLSDAAGLDFLVEDLGQM